MSYRPDDQSIEDPCRKIVAGINEFDSAVSKRIASREWNAEHIEKLCELRLRLMAFKNELELLAEETW
jgi:hypothetical protein